MDHDQTPHATAPHAPAAGSYESAIEHIQIVTPSPRDSSGASVVQPPSASAEPLLGAASEGRHTLPRPHWSLNTDFKSISFPPPAFNRYGHEHPNDPTSREQTTDREQTTNRNKRTSRFGLHLPRSTDLECIIPVDEKPGHSHRTVGERLRPTIDEACRERQKCAWKVKLTGYSLNFAIGLQVFLGALTTGISAALTGAKSAQITTAVLGGLSTLVASYLARARGSGEPELSAMRLQDLEHFLRDCTVFLIDHAHEHANAHNQLDHKLDDLRRKLEQILGNTPGEKKVLPGITATATANGAVTATANGTFPSTRYTT